MRFAVGAERVTGFWSRLPNVVFWRSPVYRYSLNWEEVLKRPEHRLVHGLDLARIDTVLTELAAVIEPVQLDFLWRPHLRDPDDEMVLETAVNGRADAIITWNVRDFAGVASRFGIDVVLPQEALIRWSL